MQSQMHPATESDIEVLCMKDALIDPCDVELLMLEVRYNPENADNRTMELIQLYKFQQRLIRQWHTNDVVIEGGGQ